jgi:hypothetical protein
MFFGRQDEPRALQPWTTGLVPIALAVIALVHEIKGAFND